MIIIMSCLQGRLFSEAQGLHQPDVVSIITVDPGQAGPPDLNQLVGAEPSRVAGLVVEIPAIIIIIIIIIIATDLSPL